MKILKPLQPLFILSLIILSCNAPKDEKEEANTSTAVQPAALPDPVTLKITEAIKKIAGADLQVGGFKLNYLVVDQLAYQESSLKDFYSWKKENLEKEKEEYKKVNQKLIQSGVAVNPSRLMDDSLKTVNAAKLLDGLYEHADTAKDLYRVSYHLSAQTNTTSYNTSYTKYLYAKDLTEARLRFNDEKK